jgi:5'-deoxynucleotidase YfbR-like HD superfamily hydrolase
MIRRDLIELIFKAFSIERWNDKLRPMALMQMDKHAHKMIIAWTLAKFEEDAGKKVNWMDIIKGGVYELLRRSVISDIQSPVYMELSKNKELLQKLNYMIFKELEPKIDNDVVLKELESYLLNENYLDPLSKEILEAAHRYSSYWEFQIIRQANPHGYSIDDIEIQLGNDIERLSSLEGIRKLKKRHNIKNFVDMCGELRYQVRWGHLPRIPQTSVLGHMMMVAVISYLLSKELDNPSEKRIYNNFFCGLFHDLPEIVTRDIIKPVKRSVPGMQEEIRRIEKKLAHEEIFPHVRSEWIPELEFFTQDEFVYKTQDIHFADFNEFLKFDKNEFSPLDGPLIKAVDEFSAFLEAWSSKDFGIRSTELEHAMNSMSHKYKNSIISGLDIGKLFEPFV